MRVHSQTILENIMYIMLQDFLHLEMTQPVRICVTFKIRKFWRIRHGMFLRMFGEYELRPAVRRVFSYLHIVP